jgi:hypothetical protein
MITPAAALPVAVAAAVAASVPGGLRRAVRAAAAVALVAAGLVLTPGLWFALAWGAWGAGGPLLAVPPGLLGGLALLGGGLLGGRAAARADARGAPARSGPGC